MTHNIFIHDPFETSDKSFSFHWENGRIAQMIVKVSSCSDVSDCFKCGATPAPGLVLSSLVAAVIVSSLGSSSAPVNVCKLLEQLLAHVGNYVSI